MIGNRQANAEDDSFFMLYIYQSSIIINSSLEAETRSSPTDDGCMMRGAGGISRHIIYLSTKNHFEAADFMISLMV
jgi:hypothetical protein